MRKLLLTCALLSATSVAMAGYAYKFDVKVSLANKNASGFLSGARRSADTAQWIACSTYTNSTYGTAYGRCSARDKAGVYAMCNASGAEMLATSRMINDTSLVEFRWDDAGNCTFLSVENGSYYMQ